MSDQHNDIAVQATNNDAAEGKASAVALGYYDDAFIQSFSARKRSSGQMQRKAPVINRGHYARVKAIDRMVSQYMDRVQSSPKTPVQIVNLGSGTDTRYWRMKAEGVCFNKFVEVDFDAMVTQKCSCIHRRPELKTLLGTGYKNDRMSASSDDYALAPADLRDTTQLESVLQKSGMDASQPVLFIAEVVLVYMSPDARTKLIRWISDTYPRSCLALYEPVLGDDRFSVIMRQNLNARQSPLIGALCDQSALVETFRETGWSVESCCDMLCEYDHNTDMEEGRRLNHIEMFDEIEEWHLLMSHYAVLYATHES